MQQTVLVTGATGNVGREIVRALTARNVAVRAGMRKPAQAEQAPGVEAVWLDYERPESFAPAMAGAKTLALLMPALNPPNEVEQATALVDAARRAGVEYIVKLSVIGADLNDASAHRQVEKYIEATSIPYAHLRPNFYMQNYTMYNTDDIKYRNRIYLPAGDGKQSLIDSRDLGDAFAIVLTEPGHTGRAYTLTGSESLDHDEIAAILSQALGRTITYARPSPEEYQQTMRAAGMPEARINTMLGLYGAVAQGWVAAISPDLPTLLGRAPITFAQYARDYADQWR